MTVDKKDMGERGAALITVILAIVVTAALGGAIYSFVATSTINQIGSMDSTKAHYLAEAGGEYGVKMLVAGASIASLNHTYTLSKGDKFQLVVTDASTPGFIKYQLLSTGTSNVTASRVVHYILSLGDPNGANIPFDADPGNSRALNPDNWNVSGGYARLNQSGSELSLNNRHGDTQVSFNWSDPNSTLPDLANIWNDYGFLIYEVQLKVKLATGHDIVSGISFRLHTNGDGVSDDSFYGLSYLWCENGSDLPALCTGAVYKKPYILLWRQAVDGTRTVMERTLARSVLPALIKNNKLRAYSTLVVRVMEKNNPVTGTRENLIYAFAAANSGAQRYRPGDIYWDYSYFTPVPWGTLCDPAANCYYVDPSYYVEDATYTTADFGAAPQDEIGIHAFGNEKATVQDMAVRFNF